MRARQRDLRALGVDADLGDVGAHGVALSVALLADLLAQRQDGLGLAQADQDVAAVDLLHLARNQRAHLVLEVLENLLALGVAHLLQQHLLGCGDGGASEVLDGDLHLEVVAGGGLFVVFARLVEQHITFVDGGHFLGGQIGIDIGIVVDHGHAQEHADLARLGIDVGLDVLLQVEVLARRVDESLLQRVEHDARVEVLRLGDEVEVLEEVVFHGVFLGRDPLRGCVSNESVFDEIRTV